MGNTKDETKGKVEEEKKQGEDNENLVFSICDRNIDDDLECLDVRERYQAT